jgi:hypothetical protein
MKTKLKKHFSDKQLFLFPLNFFNAQRKTRKTEEKGNDIAHEKCSCTAYSDNDYFTENFYKPIANFNP